MLHRLIEYAERQGVVVPPGLSPKDIRWAIECDSAGHFLEVHPLGEGKTGRLFSRCPDLTMPELVGGKEPRSHFLVETAQVVALYRRDDEPPADVKRTEGKHGFFVAMLRAASSVMPELAEAAAMLGESEELARIRERLKTHKAKPTDKVTLYVRGAFPLESEAWHEWWRGYRLNLSGGSKKGGKARAKKSSKPMVSFVSGKIVAPVMTHEKIVGLGGVGGLGPGDALVCFDKDAFSSYGLTQSANAAMSVEDAKGYREALNHLIRDSSSRIAGALVVHWFKERIPEEDDPLAWLIEPPESAERNAQKLAKELLEAVTTGTRPDLARNRYFAITLSGAAGRVMVRDWMEGAFEEIAGNVQAWFEDLSITRLLSHDEAQPPPIERVITCVLAPRKGKQEYSDWLKPLGTARRALLNCAVKGAPISAQIIARVTVQLGSFLRSGDLEDALATNRNLGPVLAPLYARMGLVKAFHIRKAKGGGPMSPCLNEEHPDPAYHCGRLLAVLAGLQRSALGDVGAGVVQRYYTATSQTPALMVGRLVANAKNHLNKLDPGLAWWFEDQIASVMRGIGDRAPRTLDLERQSLFALGYYQQLACNRAGKQDGAQNVKKEDGNG